jgi:hypothetical protein
VCSRAAQERRRRATGTYPRGAALTCRRGHSYAEFPPRIEVARNGQRRRCRACENQMAREKRRAIREGVW